MPVTIEKADGGYKVKTPSTVHAKKTTKKKAEAQARLLRALEHNKNFRPKKNKGMPYE